MARIVVLGAGRLAAFLELQSGLPKGHALTLVNADPYPYPYHWFITEFHTYVAGEDKHETSSMTGGALIEGHGPPLHGHSGGPW